jgi:hypothetical protein
MASLRKSVVEVAKEEYYGKGYIAGAFDGYLKNYASHTGAHVFRDMLVSLPDDLIRNSLAEKGKQDWIHLPIQRPKEYVCFFYLHHAPDVTEDPDLVTLKDIKLPLRVEVSDKPRDMCAHPSVYRYKDNLYLIIHEWCTPMQVLAEKLRSGEGGMMTMQNFAKYTLEAMEMISANTRLDQFVQVGGFEAIRAHLCMNS